MIKISAAKILSFFPGILAFLGYYELLSSFSAPFRFTVDRVTHLYLVQLPLLGWLELDYILYAIASIGIALLEEDRLKRFHMALVFSATLSLLLGRVLNAALIGYFGLGLAAVISAFLHAYKRGVKSLLPGFLLSTVTMETAALVSLASYYVLGEWSTTPLYIVLRERLLWTPLEWISILLLIALMWMALTKTVLGGKIMLKLDVPPPKNRHEESDRYGFMLIPLSFLLISLMIFLPHLPTVNPDFKPVSVDTISYIDFFNNVGDEGLLEALRESAERPLFILLAYGLWLAFSKNSILLMDVFHPLIALCVLALTSYYVTLKLRGSSTAGWAPLLVALGYAVPAFIGGGFQANSLALSPALIALILEPHNIAGMLKLAFPLTLTALIHPWTYTMYSAAILVKQIRDKRKFMLSLIAVALSYAVSQAVDYCLGAVIVAKVTASSVTMRLGVYAPLNWFNAIQLWVWNTLSNPLYISTSIFSAGIVYPLLAAAAPLTLIIPEGLLFRIFLNIPFQICSAEILERLKPKYRPVFLMALLVRVLGNLSGLTPLEIS